jgi:hypothetical protein
MAAAGDDAGLTQRELLMELREDIKGLKATVDAIARDQAAGVERRASVTCTRWRGCVSGKVRKTGRGERNSTAMSDAGAVVRFVRERHSDVGVRSA